MNKADRATATVNLREDWRSARKTSVAPLAPVVAHNHSLSSKRDLSKDGRGDGHDGWTWCNRFLSLVSPDKQDC